MIRYILPAALLMSLPVNANTKLKLCPLTHDQNSCSRVLACVGDQGRWFHGRAFGRGNGEVIGQMNDGSICKGEWTESGFLGFGQASVICDDGTQVDVLYTYQDRWTGTVTGRGITATWDLVEVWSGLNVLEYLDHKTGMKRRTLPCENGPLYIS